MHGCLDRDIIADSPAADQTPASKRKRRQSPTPPPPPVSATPIKINLHVPAATPPSNPQPSSGGPKIRIAPSKANGVSAEETEGELEPKRARISLKVNGDGEWSGQASGSANTAKASATGPVDVQASEQGDQTKTIADDASNESPVKSAPEGRLLSREVRAALAIVIARCASLDLPSKALLTVSCAAHLPSPLNGILTLSLPPTFVQDEKNTLGHALKQDDLTWERLVVSRLDQVFT